MPNALPADPSFPPEVHQSLAELPAIARTAKSRHDPQLRRATRDELTLAEQLHDGNRCTAHSTRTGLPCERRRIAGAMVCFKHGGAVSHVQAKAERRLLAAAIPVLNAFVENATQTGNRNAAVKAATDLLDRLGFGAMAEAKTRSSYRGLGGPPVKVHIGFLQYRSTDPTVTTGADTIDVTPAVTPDVPEK